MTEFAKVHSGKVVAKAKMPERTGYQERLYELHGFEPALAQQVEEEFFKPVDTMASDALDLLHRHGHNAPWNGKSRSAWTRFILSLLLRCPEDIEVFREWWHEDFSRTDADAEERYCQSRSSRDPETFSDFLAAQPLAVKEKYQFETFCSLVEHDKVGPKINAMEWRVLETPVDAPRLLTSDRPVIRSYPLDENGGHIALPIGPRLLFIASHDPDFLKGVLRADRRGLVKECNRQVVEGALRFVYGDDERQARFVQNRLGKDPQPRLMEQLVEKRREAAAKGLSEVDDNRKHGGHCP